MKKILMRKIRCRDIFKKYKKFGAGNFFGGVSCFLLKYNESFFETNVRAF